MEEKKAKKHRNIQKGIKQRTPSQNNALHLFCELLAKSLNEAGLDMRRVLKESIEIEWDKEMVKKYLWHPIQEAKFGTNSTIFLHKQGQIDAIHKILMRHLGQKFGVEYIEFPVDLVKQYEKVSYQSYEESK